MCAENVGSLGKALAGATRPRLPRVPDPSPDFARGARSRGSVLGLRRGTCIPRRRDTTRRRRSDDLLVHVDTTHPA